MVILPQSVGPWFSLEFQAVCVEAKQKIEAEGLPYTVADKMRYIQGCIFRVPRLAKGCPADEKHKKGIKEFPTWETICKWERTNRDLPARVRERGFLGEVTPMEAGGASDRTTGPGSGILARGRMSRSPACTYPAHLQKVIGVTRRPTTLTHRLNPEPFILSSLVGQLIGVVCLAMFLAMAGWFARQCAKIAVS